MVRQSYRIGGQSGRKNHTYRRPQLRFLNVSARSESRIPRIPSTDGRAVYKEISAHTVEELAAKPPDFTVVFTEDNNGFYINGKKFAMDAEPMLRIHVGSMQHWRVINDTRELHPLHIHQVHFFAYEENGVRSESPEWLDTVNVPYGGGTIDLIMDFTDPIHPRHVLVPLSSLESRRQRHDGQDIV
jgi:FtsP/CotA-like multicopper oxidase with cupredoxin domain